MRGRKPTPTNLKVLRGNPGRRPLNKAEAKPEPDTSYCPRWLPNEAKREWRRVVKELRRLGLLTVVDRAALEAYCETYSRWRTAIAVLEVKGMTYVTPTGFIRERPEVAIANQALRLMKAFMVEFGMTPSARTRVKAEVGEEADPFEEFLRESGQMRVAND